MRSIHSRFTHNGPRVIQVSVVFLRFCGATTWSARGMRNGRETFNRGGPPGPRAARYSRPTRLIFRADVSARLDSRIIRILRRSAGDVLFLFHFSPSHKFHRLVTYLCRALRPCLSVSCSLYTDSSRKPLGRGHHWATRLVSVQDVRLSKVRV